jgi:uncharacterized membrane protein (UPF0127 family)
VLTLPASWFKNYEYTLGFIMTHNLICVICQIKSLGTLTGLIVLFIVSSLNALACPIELPTTIISIKGHPLTVELATTPTSRGCGLSHRQDLAPNQGMLFIFPDSRPRSFWMKDTFIPLSIAYLDKSGQIMSILEMSPMQTNPTYKSRQPAGYALEVNQGWFRAHGIEIGDIVEMKLPVVLNIR